MHSNFQYEQKQHAQNQLVLGIDEVGRGPVAGPVVVGGVVFAPDHKHISGITDSKQLSAQKRVLLDTEIRNQALAYAVAESSAEIIDAQGIIFALVAAMQRVTTHILDQLDAHQTANRYRLIICCDGRAPVNPQFVTAQPQDWIIKADSSIYTVSAASIIAKVYRDQHMQQLHHQFPEYGWATNVGYGTKHHRQAIRSYGLTAYHRKSFLKKYL